MRPGLLAADTMIVVVLGWLAFVTTHQQDVNNPGAAAVEAAGAPQDALWTARLGADREHRMQDHLGHSWWRCYLRDGDAARSGQLNPTA